jgi:hypothetical protein
MTHNRNWAREWHISAVLCLLDYYVGINKPDSEYLLWPSFFLFHLPVVLLCYAARLSL